MTGVFVAERGTEVAGVACGTLLREPNAGLDAELTAVYLRREFPRAGLGRRLVDAIVEAQRKHGASGLLTWVIAGNRGARVFYEELGGELMAEQPFECDGMDRVQTAHAWGDPSAHSAACRAPEASS